MQPSIIESSTMATSAPTSRLLSIPPSRFASRYTDAQIAEAKPLNRKYRPRKNRQAPAPPRKPQQVSISMDNPPIIPPSRFASRYTDTQEALQRQQSPQPLQSLPQTRQPQQPLKTQPRQSPQHVLRYPRRRRPKLPAIIRTTGPCFTKPWEEYRLHMTTFKLHFTTPSRFLPTLESILEHPPQPREEVLRMEQVLRWKFGYVLCQLLQHFERIHLDNIQRITMPTPQSTTTLISSLTLLRTSTTTGTRAPHYILVLDSFLQLYYFHKLRPPDVFLLGPISFQRAYFFFRGRPPEGFGSTTTAAH